MSFTKAGSAAGGYVDGVATPEAIALLSEGALGSREAVEAEIDHMLSEVRGFWCLEPDEAMRVCAGFSARCTELYVHLHRVEGRQREWRQIRTQQIVPLLDELERQFKIASRSVELRRQDLEVLRGF